MSLKVVPAGRPASSVLKSKLEILTVAPSVNPKVVTRALVLFFMSNTAASSWFKTAKSEDKSGSSNLAFSLATASGPEKYST
ncbi:MAG: hypothetical protein A2746_01730 [Candidatus Yanofskybacteria bacterium RIFCSPHIGHO2_01_FULL_44_22]|uniref:Uncharacterized protein n=1 Tax=Candidatus Yanofskybacteria bacterium RIFCSPHIGHO2_01_FULL_44_22 TaxID=1802669 RepID=A0A1F8ETF3_9BACT|nr:MAG: hypothetical protein A2746_01730 [Candidatus Yanofskybacteria bacterium RIFCSPHIGHO2_01_FULL_44_22]